MLIRTLTVLSFAAAVYAIPIALDKNGLPEYVPDKTTPTVTKKNPTPDFASSVQAETVLPELQTTDPSFEDFPGFGLETSAPVAKKSVTNPMAESNLESDFSDFGRVPSEPVPKSGTARTTELALKGDFSDFDLETPAAAPKSVTPPITASVDDSFTSDFPVVPTKPVTVPTKAPTTPPAEIDMVDLEQLVNKLVAESEAVLGDIDDMGDTNPPTASIPTGNPDNKPVCPHHKAPIWTKSVELQVGVHGRCNTASDCGSGECCSDFNRCGTTRDHCTSRNPLSAGLYADRTNIPRPRILNDPFATPLSDSVIPTSTTKGGIVPPPVGFAQDQPKPAADCHCSKKPAAVSPLSVTPPVPNPSAFPEDVSRLSNPPGPDSRLSSSPFISAPVSNPRSLTSPSADDVFADPFGNSRPTLPAVTPKKTECEKNKPIQLNASTPPPSIQDPATPQ